MPIFYWKNVTEQMRDHFFLSLFGGQNNDAFVIIACRRKTISTTMLQYKSMSWEEKRQKSRSPLIHFIHLYHIFSVSTCLIRHTCLETKVAVQMCDQLRIFFLIYFGSTCQNNNFFFLNYFLHEQTVSTTTAYFRSYYAHRVLLETYYISFDRVWLIMAYE